MDGEICQGDDTALRHRLDFSEQSTSRKPLSPKMQKLLESEECFDYVYATYPEGLSVLPYRYIAYTSQVRTILHSASRYTAYACSVTENFRFFGRRFLTRGVSAISWAYIIYDVVKEGCKAYSQNRGVLAPLSEAYKDARDLNITSIRKDNAVENAPKSSTPGVKTKSTGWEDDACDSLEPWPVRRIPLADDYRVVMAKRAIFHGIASITLPNFTIHRIVKCAGRYFKLNNTLLARSYMPAGLGLLAVPFLPYLFDGPVHSLVELGCRRAICLIRDGEYALSRASFPA